MANHPRVRLEGVCDHPYLCVERVAVVVVVVVLRVEEEDLVGDAVGEALFAPVDERVVRLRVDESSCGVVASSDSWKSEGWLRVPTIFELFRVLGVFAQGLSGVGERMRRGGLWVANVLGRAGGRGLR